MVNLAPVFKQRFFDLNGKPLVGGKLYSYAAGTTTPKVTFQDRDALAANVNPIILNDRGECDCWIFGTYKFVLKDANNVTQWTVDKVASEPQAIMTVADITARNAIPAQLRYQGMLVYVVSENKTYQLQGGITNANWAVFYGSTPVIDTFAGNGVLTTFNLTTNPGFKENVLVFIDGVRQEISQYSTVDSALTFGFAPYDGASIQTIVMTVNVVNVPANASVTTPKIADSAVTEEKINNNAVATAKINNNAVTEQKIDTDAVTTTKIKNGNVTRTKIAAVGEVISLGSANFTTNATVMTDVTNLSINFTATGKRVFIKFVPDGAFPTVISTKRAADTASTIMRIMETTLGAELCRTTCFISATGATAVEKLDPIGGFEFSYVPAAGNYTYKVQIQNGVAGSTPIAGLSGVRLMAYESL